MTLPFTLWAMKPVQWTSMTPEVESQGKRTGKWWSSVQEGWVRPGVYASKKRITVSSGTSAQLQSPSTHMHGQTGDLSLLTRGKLNHWVVYSPYLCAPFLGINFSLVHQTGVYLCLCWIFAPRVYQLWQERTVSGEGLESSHVLK